MRPSGGLCLHCGSLRRGAPPPPPPPPPFPPPFAPTYLSLPTHHPPTQPRKALQPYASAFVWERRQGPVGFKKRQTRQPGKTWPQLQDVFDLLLFALGLHRRGCNWMVLGMYSTRPQSMPCNNGRFPLKTNKVSRASPLKLGRPRFIT